MTGHTFYKFGTQGYIDHGGDTNVCGYLVRYVNPEASGANMEVRCTADGEQSTVLATIIFEVTEKTDAVSDGWLMRNSATSWNAFTADGSASVE